MCREFRSCDQRWILTSGYEADLLRGVFRSTGRSISARTSLLASWLSSEALVLRPRDWDALKIVLVVASIESQIIELVSLSTT